MRRLLMMGLLPLFCAGLLTGCSDVRTLLKLQPLPPPQIPGALLLPCEGPSPPGPNATQRDAALVVEDFKETLASCNADKAAIAEIANRPAKP